MTSRDAVATVPEEARPARPDVRSGERRDDPRTTTAEPALAVALTEGQRGLWALARVAPSSPLLHIAVAARVADGDIDTAAFGAALEATVARHPAWRTTFHETEDGVEARVGTSSAVALLEERLAPADDGEPDERPAIARLEAIAGEPFDLAAGPLLRVAVVRQDPRTYLLFVVHHLVADLWSLAVAIGQVGERYGELLAAAGPAGPAKRPTPVSPGAGAWGEHVAREAARLAGDEGSRLAQFWRRCLADPPPSLELPADRPPPALPSFRGGVVHARLDRGLTGRLRRRARQQGTTPLAVLLAVFDLWLVRITGQRDLIVGTPVAGRGRSTAGLVGYLVDMVAVRAAVDETASFASLVAAVGAAVKEAIAHRGYPLARLAQAPDSLAGSGLRGDGRPPFFRVALGYQKAPKRGPAAAFGALSMGVDGVRFPIGPLDMTSVALDTRTAQLDLTVLAAEVDGRLGLAFRYDADRFGRDTVRRWQRHVMALLRAALDHPERPVGSLPMLDADDHDRLLRRLNDSVCAIELAPEPIDRLVAQQAGARPGALAVAAPDGELSYAQLDRRARCLAGRLTALGAGPERVVGVVVERSTWLPVALLGTWHAGAAYLQIDPALPDERIAFLVRDAGVVAIVTVACCRARLGDLEPPTVVLDDADEPAAEPPPAGNGPGLDRLAYLIYTSGSTGRPKGVAVGHRSLRNLIGWYHRAYRLGPGDRVSQLAGLGFDATVFEIWPALTAGASLHLADEQARLDPTRLGAWLEAEGVTVAFLPTPLAEAYLREPGAGAAPLRFLLAAGERLRSFRPPGFGARLRNLYGPTESTVATTEAAVPLAGEAPAGSLPSIGRPIGNLRLYVLDRRQRLAPPGAVGELWIGGAGVARGYHRRPALTADRFRPDPWGRPGDRLYRSGDRVRLDADDRLDFRGRIDHQLKIRGFRIEPGEVESALRALEEVAEAVVEARGEGTLRRLVAWVVPAAGTPADASSEPDAPPWTDGLAAALDERLPSYLVPTAWVVLDGLPLTANGKIDRRALPAPARPVGGGDAPRSGTEKAVAALWCALLATDPPGRDDDFFALGGHSLLAAQLVARLRATRGVAVSVRAVFEHPRLADLAAHIEAADADGNAGAPIPPRPADRPPALSFAQERLWFLDQLHPGLLAYNLPAAVDLHGMLQLDALAAALTALVARHEVLRTRLVATEAERPRQVIDPPAPVPLPVIDLGPLPPAELRAAVEARAATEAATPFDLAAGPLLRARLLRATGTDGAIGHTLLLTLHHSVADGLSMAVLQRELVALYAREVEDGAPALPPLDLQYADYAVWQRDRLASGALDHELAYWREHLQGIPEVLALPTDRPRPARVDHRGARLEVAIDAARVGALEALAQRHDVTLFMVLLAAYHAMLARLTGVADVVIGTPVAGRPRSELEGLVGLFVNLVAIRVDAGADPRFDRLLGRIRSAVLDAFDHQEIPFEQVVEAVHPARSQGHTPIFQVLFALVDAPRQDLRAADLAMGWWAPARATAQFDLGLSLLRGDNGVTGELEYRTALFDPATAERIAGRYLAVLDAVLADASLPLSSLPLLTPPEAAWLSSWNATETPLAPLAETSGGAPVPPTLPALVAACGRRDPDAVALELGERSLTYGELLASTAQLAHHLRGLGVGPEVLVGICAERSLELVVGLLGILRAGGAYVPLDPAYPEDRLGFMVEDAGAPVILLQGAVADRLPATDAVLVSLDADAPWRADAVVEEARSALDRVDADALAYVIFTSGSTGRPKGAMNRHRGIVNRLLWMREAYRVSRDDRFLQKTPFSFDVSVWELFAPLVVGARLVIAPPEMHKDSRRLSELIATAGVTIVHFVPSMLREFLREPALDRHCASVRLVIASGEALPIDLVERLAAQLPGVRLDNLYGPTEAAVEVTAWPCAEADGTRVVPIGRPIANTRMHVLDDQLRDAPIGVHGELFIGGVQVGRGYHRRPRLTAERFVPDPLAGTDRPGARLYATGDRARWRNDGTIEYLGRVDFQVKLRGLRIELGEIETVLAEHPRVHEAVVGLRATPAGDQLVAYLTDEGGRPEVEDLAEHLAARLPAYMVPRLFLFREAMPLSPSGKVDRRALERMDLPSLAGGAAARPPGTATERQVAALWAVVLGRDPGVLPAADDDFFALGGHSLLATQLAGRLRRRFEVELPLSALFEHTTVAGQAAAVDAERVRGRQRPAAPPLVPGAGDRASRELLSFAQERLWLVEQILGPNAAYNMHGALLLDGPLDVDRLERSLHAIVDRHEALRTAFPSEGGRPRAVVSGTVPVVVERADLIHLAPAARDAAAEAIRRREAAWRFDIAAGPLFRFAVVRLTPARHLVLVTLHHIVADGWSLGILQRELAAIYGALTDDRPVDLPDVPVQYADFAAWQRAWLTDERLAPHLTYWRATLGDLHPKLHLPALAPRSGRRSLRGAVYPWRLSAERTAGLRALGRAEGATLFMTLLAVLQTVLHRYDGGTDIRVGAPVANRRPEPVEGLIGCFVNMLVVRGDLGGDPTFRVFLGRVRDTVVGAQEHQDLPYEKLVEAVRTSREAGAVDLFDVVLAYQSAPAEPPTLPGLRVERLPAVSEQAKFDLSLYAEERAGELMIDVEHRLEVLDTAAAVRLTGHLEQVIDAVIADPDRPVGTLPLLTASERRVVLEAWNATAAEAEGGSVLARFLARARGAPDAVAMVEGEGSIDYRTLDRWSDALARDLIAAGVGQHDVVALSIGRSGALAAAALAAWKVGAAYLPLDPADPGRRRRFILEDARAAALMIGPDDLRGLDPGALPMIAVVGPPAPETAASGPPVDAGGDALALAYVIYTSGSTGRPKGVEVTHGGLANLVTWHCRTFGSTAADRGSLIASPAFDASIWELWPYLATGASVVVPADAVRVDPPRLLAWMAEQRVTTSFLPVPLAEAVLDLPQPTGLALRTVLTGGDRVRRRPPPGLSWTLVNCYGPTENSVVSTSATVEAEAAGLPTIGGPIANHRVYVLDSAFEPVPVGVAGELLVGGLGVARGYRGRPARTAAAFVPDPWGPPGSRLYCTGDRVRWRRDGGLGFLGRVDHQVQIRGVRVELGEVEAALSSHPQVREAVAVVREGEAGPALLSAYVAPVAEAAGRLDAAALRSHLLARLPEPMVPAATVVVDALPRTANGKVDLARLPQPPAAAADDQPMSEREASIAGVFADVLGLDAVGRHDDFFALGGHSLLANQAAARIRDALEVDLELRTIFERPTAASLARHLAGASAPDRGAEPAASALPPIEAAAYRAGEPHPLSFAQQRLWILDRIEPGSPAYNITVAARLEGPLEVARLRASLRAVVARHDALRTTFVAEQGMPRQVVDIGEPADLTVIDLRAFDPDRRAEESARRVAEIADHRFDLARGPLLLAALIRERERRARLVVNLHHTVGDGWSLGIFLRELSACYGLAGDEGAPVSRQLAPLPLRYADFARWQRRWLTDEAMAPQLAYWRRALAGTPAASLPTDRPRPPVQRYRGATVSRVLPAELAARVESFGRRRGSTLFMTVASALGLLLSRLTGERDVSVGFPVSERRRTELEGSIGLFLNTLVLRVDTAAAGTVEELVALVRRRALAAYAHQDVPFEAVVDALVAERDASRTPLFQVLLNVVAIPFDAQDLAGGLRVEPEEIFEAASKFDLTLYVAPREDGIHVDAVYNRDLFLPARMVALLDQLIGLLVQMTADPEAAIDSLSLITPAARAAIPDPAAELAKPSYPSVPASIAAWAVVTPDAAAVVQGEETVSYAAFERSVSALASAVLRLFDEGRGFQVGDVVAVHGAHRPGLIVAMAAVLRAGGVLLCLDAALPPARVADMLTLADCRWLVTVGDAPEDAPAATWLEGRARLMVAGDGSPVAAGETPTPGAGGAAMPEPAGDAPAYLFFTSGTSGTPKAVLGCHRGLGHFLAWQRETFEVGPGDRSGQLTGLSFDVVLRDVFLPLTSGATLVLPDAGGEALGPDVALGWLDRQRVSLLHLVPTVAEMWLADRRAEASLASLRWVFFAGEPLTDDLVTRWRTAFPRAGDIANFYGPTETSLAKCAYTVPATPPSGVQPIGRPLPSTQVLIVGRASERPGDGSPIGVPCGAFEPGEIVIRTPFRSLGYVGPEDGDRFVVNPHTGDPDDLLYRTGDLGCYGVDGRLEILGRIDDQVKVRGVRVEPGEVAAVLREAPGVDACAVVAFIDHAGRKALAGYVVPAAQAGEAGPEAVATWRAFLAARLPPALVPSALVPVPALPRTANGKLDRAALPDPRSAAAVAPAPAYVAPRDEVEEALAAIWATILGRRRVGVEDNFFELGGDSLLAIRMVAHAHRQGLGLVAKEVFQHQTVAALAPRVRREATDADAPAIDREPVAGPVPLTQVQRRFFDEIMAATPDRIHHFNIDRLIALPADTDFDALGRALEAVLAAHDAFTLRFQPAAAPVVQQRVPTAEAGFDVLREDLSGLSEEAQREAIEAKALAFQTGLDLADGPLVRAALITLGADRPGRLLLVLHHLLADAYSMVVVEEELGVAYEQLRRGEPVRLPAATTPFTAWAERLDAHARSPELERERAYWLDQPWGDTLTLPADAPDAPMPIHSMRAHLVALEAEDTAWLLRRAPSVADGASLAEVVVSALTRAAASWAAGEDGAPAAGALHVDIIGHGRDAFLDGVDLSRTVGWLAIVFPFLARLPDDDDPLAALRAVAELSRAVPNAGVGYGVLRFLDRDRDRRTAFEAAIPRAGMVLNFFSSLGQHERAAATEGMSIAPEAAGPRLDFELSLLYPLMLTSHIAEGQLVLRFNHSAARYRAETVERMAEDVLGELRALAARMRSLP